MGNYYRDDIESQMCLLESAHGRRSAIEQAGMHAWAMHPELRSALRAAHLAVSMAVREELSGRRKKGLEIRRQLREIGQQMRVRARPIIGVLAGIRLAQTATLRPGGDPAFRETESSMNTYRADAERYALYLNRIGEPAEAGQSVREMKAGLKARSIALKTSLFSPFGGKITISLIAWWFGCLVLLGNAFMMVVLSTTAIALRRSPKAREGQRLPFATRWAVFLGILSIGPVLAHLAGMHSLTWWAGEIPPVMLWLLCLIVTYTAARLYARWHPLFSRNGFLHGLAAYAMTILVSGVFAYAVIPHGKTLASVFSFGYVADSPDEASWANLLINPFGWFMLLFPFYFAFGTFLNCLWRRISVTVGMIGAFARAGLPSTAGLLVLYAVMVYGTAK